MSSCQPPAEHEHRAQHVQCVWHGVCGRRPDRAMACTRELKRSMSQVISMHAVDSDPENKEFIVFSAESATGPEIGVSADRDAHARSLARAVPSMHSRTHSRMRARANAYAHSFARAQARSFARMHM